MRISTGHWVDGDAFFGRARELRNMANALSHRRASVFIPGPRRTGKTSLVHEFIRRNNTVYQFVYFDLEGRNSIIEFCTDLIKKLETDHSDFVRSTLTATDWWNNMYDCEQ